MKVYHVDTHAVLDCINLNTTDSNRCDENRTVISKCLILGERKLTIYKDSTYNLHIKDNSLLKWLALHARLHREIYNWDFMYVSSKDGRIFNVTGYYRFWIGVENRNLQPRILQLRPKFQLRCPTTFRSWRKRGLQPLTKRYWAIAR